MRLADDACEGFVKSLVAEVARERRGQSCLAVSSSDGVNNSFESGVRCAEGCEFPQECLKGRLVHGKDVVEGVVCDGPCDDRFPVSPSLEAGGLCCAQRAEDFGEGLALSGDAWLDSVSEAGKSGFKVAVKIVQGGADGVV